MVGLLFFSACTAVKKEDTQLTKEIKPNIILLLADDLGYGELGSYGQKEIKTPFLDSIAKRGLLISNPKNTIFKKKFFSTEK